MKKLIYVPLEHIDGRYTVHLDMDIEQYLNENDINYIKVDPPTIKQELPDGMFLNAAGTIQTKAHQINEIAKLYEQNLVDDDTTFFFSDIWFPGVESLAYLNYFYKVSPKITGFIHAGSFTDTDFVRDMERWAKNFEDVVFDISDTIYVASKFIKDDILKKRIIDSSKLTVSRLPLDSKLDNYKTNQPKENIVVFNGRLCDEKQPWLFDALADKYKDTNWKFVKTQQMNLSKDEYYKLLAKSKVIVSFALQENFGYGVAEAVDLGCIPIVPNRLVYPELYAKTYLYNTFEECCEMVDGIVKGTTQLQAPKLEFKKPFDSWFGRSKNK